MAVQALIEEVLDRSLDELAHIAILAGGQFILDPFFDLWGQIQVHDILIHDFTINGA
ncbi:hypothetical protein SBA4_5080008 [Candidatus Sulfopaludibacter sp. SbA4]|nr:hypothetical protein SBA4_5080008 [Candidatus Sulfopaludibacter sp. SbA4]